MPKFIKKYVWKKEFIIWGIFSFVTIIVTVAISFGFIHSYNQRELAYLDSELMKSEGKFNATLKSLEHFSNYIYDETLNQEKIKLIMSQVMDADESKKNVLREDLNQMIKEDYERIRSYGFLQLHFHLPNTESFLRVHYPDRYGDILSEIRETVRLANECECYITGFEEGKVYSGFRFVYPLEYEGNHIGTVENSISSASIVKILEEIYPNEEVYFIIKKDIVDEKVFTELMDNHTSSIFSDQYYMDNEVASITNRNEIHLTSENSQRFIDELKSEISGRLDEETSFSFVKNFEDEDYIINGLALKNIKNESIAYYLIIYKTEQYRQLYGGLNIKIILLITLILTIIIFGLIVTLYQIKIKRILQKDHLTQIYNRHRFMEIIKEEFDRSKRYHLNTAIIILDIDHFKKVNDTHGHNWGDDVLRTLAHLVKENIRHTDVFARWGGEEFIIMLPHTSKSEAYYVAEKIRVVVEMNNKKKMKGITISLGVTNFKLLDRHVLDAVKRADEAMYMAKKAGRNKVWSYM